MKVILGMVLVAVVAWLHGYNLGTRHGYSQLQIVKRYRRTIAVFNRSRQERRRARQ